ncbi:MAG: hypothetical protein SWX82_30095 [Cyanobacteriota bacterium]|nr:hypothetical protein [Cyanobacteriota bacterium]
MLYEKLDFTEYWVVNVVADAQLIAFAIAEHCFSSIASDGSRAIGESQLPPLPFSLRLLEEALRQCRTTDRSQIYTWLISQIQNLDD